MKPVRRDLPSGHVTFLFTDVEGSTKLLHELGAAAYGEALAEHRRILRRSFAAHGGVEVDTQGDAFFVAFPTAAGALEAAREALAVLVAGPIRVRIGIHSGTAHLTHEGYVGEDVHKAARIAAAGHGGQVLLSKDTRELVAFEVQDLGEHRLKDFAAPVWIFQLGSERYPPLKTISNTNLPRPASSFVGREQEVEEVLAMLQDGARLLTLTGPGGSGKTRLAIEAAAALVPEFRNGVFWVGLAPLREPALVVDTIAQTLGAEDGLADHIGERELLLLLDNFEHVVEAAPDLASLVERCRNLRLLVTSRERLRVRGEVEYPVMPLAEPEAVELFCARARLEPDETVAELCRRLDGLPLAVELAAARTSVLSPVQILERLSQRLDLLRGGRDAEARQETLRATIAWSYELLDEEEKRLFARLAVFAGGCTLEAAEEVAEADLDTLASLVNKSLLRRDGERYVMLETICEYARERLEQSGAAERTIERVAEYLLRLGEEQEGSFRSALDRGLSFARLEPELANFRATLNWALEAPAPMLALRLAILPIEGRMLSWNGAEVMSWVEQALPHIDEAPLRLRADVLRAAGTVVSGDVERSIRLFEESLSLYRQLGNDARVVNTLRWLGLKYMRSGVRERARTLLEESLELARRIDDARGTYEALHSLGELERRAGNLEEAASLLEQSATLARRASDDHSLASALHSLANLALGRNQIDRAVRLYNQSLKLSHELGLRQATIHCLAGLASAAAASGACERAGRLWGAAETAQRESGWSIAGPVERLYEEHIHVCADDASTTFAAALERGRKMALSDAVEYAFSARGGVVTSTVEAG